MMLLIRNWLRQHNWVESEDYFRALRMAQEYKIADWRKLRCLERIAAKADTCKCEECRLLGNMALNGLNQKGIDE